MLGTKWIVGLVMVMVSRGTPAVVLQYRYLWVGPSRMPSILATKLPTVLALSLFAARPTLSVQRGAWPEQKILRQRHPRVTPGSSVWHHHREEERMPAAPSNLVYLGGLGGRAVTKEGWGFFFMNIMEGREIKSSVSL